MLSSIDPRANSHELAVDPTHAPRKDGRSVTVEVRSAASATNPSRKLPTPAPRRDQQRRPGLGTTRRTSGVWLVSRFLWVRARFFGAFGAAGALSVFVGLMKRRSWWRRQVGCWCSVSRRRRDYSVSRARMRMGWWRGASSRMCGWGVASSCLGTRSTRSSGRLRTVRRPRERRHGRRGPRQSHGRVAGARGVG